MPTYVDSGIITKALVTLISSKLIDDLSEKSKSKLTTDLSSNAGEFSKEAFNRYRTVVKSNNGIVDRDQKRFLVPIGFDPATVDVVLMNNLHVFRREAWRCCTQIQGAASRHLDRCEY
ncbi:hypothetical protein QCE73_25015 [Caballeronia sp. LZ029]|uniref:hypothetical protein n=1 Tax=Caballeronia sp. LZ029 TaxID=3038564 RepID=UPI0028570DB3|nr:hypothetical protein [Caballeronia sp. LZ029]MDR5746437.1 hypothetical protein [Caballeronia sp. LZ029]